MNISKVIKIGLITAFSFSLAILSSCDGGGGGGGEPIFPEVLKAGDTIVIKGSGGPTLNIIDGSNLSYVTDTDTLPATYDYVSSGSRYEIDLDFNLTVEGQQAVTILNQAIADPSSSLNDLIFSNRPTNAELNFFIKAVEDANLDVTLDFDNNFNLFVQDSFKLLLPRSGKGTVENIISGQGIKLILGNGGRLLATELDGSDRSFKFEYQKDAGVSYLSAP